MHPHGSCRCTILPMSNDVANTRENATTASWDVSEVQDSGPLSRRLAGSRAHQEQTTPDPALAEDRNGIAYATLGMLDGTVVARLQCHDSLGTAVIGRGSLSSIRLHDPFVHRMHAEVHWDAGASAHVITHGGGANGTLVNMQRIEQPTRLADGARIRVGKTELVYRRFWYPGS